MFAIAPALLLAHRARCSRQPTNLWIRCQQAVALDADKHCVLGIICVVAQISCGLSAIWLVYDSTLGWHVQASSVVFALLAIFCSLGATERISKGKRSSHVVLISMSLASSYGIVFVRLVAAMMHSFGLIDSTDLSRDAVQIHYGCSFWAGFAFALPFALMLIYSITHS